jgi:CubicO group peptidase (beta-lactamase class C family)
MKPDWTAANWFWGWGYRGMGGVVTTALDVMKWDRALRGDKILGAAAKEKLYTPALEKYACGWLVDRGERGGTKVHHSGSVRGYGCQIARWLEDDIIVVVLSNGAVSPHAVEQAVAQVVFASR